MAIKNVTVRPAHKMKTVFQEIPLGAFSDPGSNMRKLKIPQKIGLGKLGRRAGAGAVSGGDRLCIQPWFGI